MEKGVDGGRGSVLGDGWVEVSRGFKIQRGRGRGGVWPDERGIRGGMRPIKRMGRGCLNGVMGVFIGGVFAECD